jgi:hypothetical protein
MPAATRCGSINRCFETLLGSEEILLSIVNSRDFVGNSPAIQKEARKALKATISDADFVSFFRKAMFILKPIDELITKFQSDCVPVSDVYVDFLNLPLKFETEAAKRVLTGAEIDYLKSLVKSRFQFIYGDAHGLGYLLDPGYIGEKLERSLRKELEYFIVKYPLENGEKSNEKNTVVYRQLTDYLISANSHKERNSFRYQMFVQEQKLPLSYWLTDGMAWPLLQKIARKVLCLLMNFISSDFQKCHTSWNTSQIFFN